MRLGLAPPQRPKTTFICAFTAHVHAAFISANLSFTTLFPHIELLISQSPVFTVSVSQHSWYSEVWIDETGGSKKQQPDYCSLLLICQIKELSTVLLREKKIAVNKIAKVRVNKSSDLTRSSISQEKPACYRWWRSELHKNKSSNANFHGTDLELVSTATPPLLPISHLADKSPCKSSFMSPWMARWLRWHLGLKALFRLFQLHDSETWVHRGVQSSCVWISGLCTKLFLCASRWRDVHSRPTP